MIDEQKPQGQVAQGNCTPAPSQVGSRTGAPVSAEASRPCHVSSPLHVARNVRILLRCTFGVPHCAPPFASCRGLWSRWDNFQPVASHSIGVEQPESVVQPPPTPSFPAEALSLLSLRQMAPDLLLHPIFDEAEALAGVPHREVVHPSP